MKLNWNKVVFVAVSAFAAIGFVASVVANQEPLPAPERIQILYVPTE